MSAAHWETVRKPSKKGKPADQNGLTKAQKKSFVDNMPRLHTAAPVKESSTIYDAFIEKEKPAKVSASTKDTSQAAGNGVSQRKPHKSKHSGGGDRKDPPKPTNLEDAVKKVDVKELENVLANVQATFPDNPSVWLKDLASILNLKMDKVPEPDPVFHGKPNSYPLCLLSNGVRKMLQKTVNQCSTQTLEHFIEHCVQSMIGDMSRGISTYGYQILIQLLLHDKPDLIMTSLPKYHELIKMNQNRPLRCLAILWAIGQTGVKKFQNGIKVWLEFMFPVLSVRALSAYSVEYLENLFKTHKNWKPSSTIMKAKEFFHVADVMFTPQPSLPSALQKRLQALYPDLQRVAFGPNPESSLHTFFVMFLNRSQVQDKKFRALVMDSLVTCLSVDKTSFSEWRQVYTKQNLTRNGVLLKHLCSNWNTVSNVVNKKLLKETIRSFTVTNDDMAAKSSQAVDGLDMCVVTCKELLTKMNRTRFPWRWLIFLLFSLVTSLVAYDVYKSKGFKRSQVRKALSDAGVLVFLEQVGERLGIFSSRAATWMQENVPSFYNKVCDFAGPYMQLFWEKLYDFGIFIVEVTQPIRAWLNVNIPLALEWVQSKMPWLWEGLVFYSSLAWDFLLKYSLLIWERVVCATHCTRTWLLENVFIGNLSPENILSFVTSVLVAIQSYTSIAVQWISDLVQGSAASPKQ